MNICKVKYHAFFYLYDNTKTVCSDYLGVTDGDIPNENIQASDHHANHDAWKGRLNGTSLWIVKGDRVNPWIQADIGYQTFVSGVITQGDGDQKDNKPDWVTTFKVSTFKISTSDEEVFVSDEDGSVKVRTFVTFCFLKTGIITYRKPCYS